jgi:CDP-diglyceride synthetase
VASTLALLVGQVFWLSLAVAVTGILHMVVVKVDWLPALKVPIDGGRTLGGEPIFGPNKTWRGIVVMIVGSAAIGAAQGLFGGEWAARAGVEVLDFAAVGRRLGGSSGGFVYLLGYAGVNAVLGLGYALGELPNSFVKRRFGIDPGRTTRGALGALFFVIDQADSVVFALILGALCFGFGWDVVIAGSVCLTLLHLAINGSLYASRVRRNL